MPDKVSEGEILGKLHHDIKAGKIANTASAADSTMAAAGWIIANIYDPEREHGSNRTALLHAIALAMQIYKGDI